MSPPDTASSSPNILSLLDILISDGWERLELSAPDSYRSGGTTYCTVRRGPVRMAITGATTLSEKRGDVFFCMGEPRHITLVAVIVEPDHRRQGAATAAVKGLVAAASRIGCTVYVHAEPIERRTITVARLRKWYSSMGWARKSPAVFETPP